MSATALMVLAALLTGPPAPEPIRKADFPATAYAAAVKAGHSAAHVAALNYRDTLTLAGVAVDAQGNHATRAIWYQIRRQVKERLAADEKATALAERKAALSQFIAATPALKDHEVAEDDDGNLIVRPKP